MLALNEEARVSGGKRARARAGGCVPLHSENERGREPRSFRRRGCYRGRFKNVFFLILVHYLTTLYQMRLGMKLHV
jgi:hypothetical protein